MKQIIIFYHQGCLDGFTAAWVAWKKFGSSAQYIPMRHDDQIPKGLKNKQVYFLDITHFGEKLKKILKDNEGVTIIDHHITAEKAVKSAPNYLFSLKNSGAGLTWRFFHKDKKTPLFVKLIEEQDLWKFKSPHAKEILAAIDAKTFNFKTWDKIAADLEKPTVRKKYIASGKAILEYRNRSVKKILENMEIADFHNHKTGVVNSPVLESEIGKEIYSSGSEVALIWHRRKGKIKVSLRSAKVDVSKLAERHGGGGHKGAAGFTFDAKKQFPWHYIK